MSKKIIGAVVLWRIILYLIAYYATFFIPLNKPFTAIKDFGMHKSYLVWVWANFDGNHYLEIARNGYHTFTAPFFPLYPLVIREVSLYLSIPYIISGQIVSTIAILGAVVVISKIMAIDEEKKLFSLVLTILLLFPTSFFYVSVYTDSLFFFLATTTIYYGRRKKWFLASLCGALATLCRLNGLALLFFISVEYLYKDERSNKHQWSYKNFIARIKKSINLQYILRDKIYCVLFIPLFFLAYLLFVHLTQGHWSIVFSSMKIWQQQRMIIPVQVFWRYAKLLYTMKFDKLFYWIVIAEISFVSFYGYMIYYSFKKMRLSYWVFMLVSFLIPATTGTFQGMPRYGLHLFPFFLSIVYFLRERSTNVKVIYFVVSCLLLIIFLSLFTRGYFVA